MSGVIGKVIGLHREVIGLHMEELSGVEVGRRGAEAEGTVVKWRQRGRCTERQVLRWTGEAEGQVVGGQRGK